MTWAAKRQLTYFSIVFFVVLAVLAVVFRTLYLKPPSCADGRMNGDERGIDCGGSCALVCRADTSTPLVLWSRSFPVTDSIVNVAAYVENQNVSAYGFQAPYEFRLYDERNFLITKVTGTTFINPNGRQLVFFPGVQVGERQPVSVTFAFTGPVAWYKSTVNAAQLPSAVSDVRPGFSTANPTLSAQVTNTGLYLIDTFKVSALIYDEKNNARAVSQTVVDPLEPGASALVVFTWPYALGEGVFRYVVEPLIDAPLVQR
jgi:hypothetical protein